MKEAQITIVTEPAYVVENRNGVGLAWRVTARALDGTVCHATYDTYEGESWLVVEARRERAIEAVEDSVRARNRSNVSTPEGECIGDWVRCVVYVLTGKRPYPGDRSSIGRDGVRHPVLVLDSRWSEVYDEVECLVSITDDVEPPWRSEISSTPIWVKHTELAAIPDSE
jgi:hypothetical protein